MKTRLSFKQSITAGLMAGVASVIINVILFLIFHAAGIITDNLFIMPGKPLGALQVAISSMVPALIASMVFFLLEKYTKNGFKIFAIISIMLMVLSFLNPFLEIPGVTVAYGIVLDFMHVVVVAALLYSIKRQYKN